MSERRLTGAELEASRWIARLEASDVSLRDHDNFRIWLDASPANRAAYEAVNRTWDKLDALRSFASESTKRQTPTTSRRALLLGAGTLATTAGAAVFWWSRPTYAATFETTVAGRQSATLQDGSAIELNGNTSIATAFTHSSRRARIRRGEALFNLTSDDPRPFTIETPFGPLTTEGGSVLVDITTNRARALVLEGSLHSDSSTASEREELIIGETGSHVRRLTAASPERRLAWRTGMLAFDGETLAEATAAVARQTDVTFRFSRPELAELQIGGYIRASDLDSFVALLEANLGLTVTRNRGEIIIGADE